MTRTAIRPVAVATLLGLATLPLQAKDAEFSNAQAWLDAANPQIDNIDTAALQAFITEHPESELIDVRLPEEVAFQGGTIVAGRRTHIIPRGWIEFQVDTLVPDRDTPLIVYCGTNLRSPLAALTLQDMGYSNVQNYVDGAIGWQQEGLPLRATDEAVGTQLYRRPMQVSENVYSAIGATAPPTAENAGHNNNLSFILTEEGVVVVNAGDNALLAQALHEEIRALTDQPVVYVILENGQGHAMLGSSYWQAQGAKVIAHVDAASEIEHRGEAIFERMRLRNRDKAMGTTLSMPDITFEDEYLLELGSERIEILHLGPAHSPGDISVWLPGQKLVIAGDMAFHERLLPIFDDTDTQGWLETWPKFEALGATTVIPGHGHPTTIDVVREYTYGYLSYLREQIGELLDDGGSLADAYKIDQSAYQNLDTFDELAGLNADRVYRAMEFE